MIVAVDFDGILCQDAFPEIGRPNYEIVALVREIIDAGHEVVLWTCRVDARLKEAIEWCERRRLHFCAVNENAPSNRLQYERQYPNGTRKVYADVYLDDKDLAFVLVKKTRGYNEALRRMSVSARKVILNG